MVSTHERWSDWSVKQTFPIELPKLMYILAPLLALSCPENVGGCTRQRVVQGGGRRYAAVSQDARTRMEETDEHRARLDFAGSIAKSVRQRHRGLNPRRWDDDVSSGRRILPD